MEYSLLAGDRAAHVFANIEAKEHYERALQAAERVMPRPDPEVVAGLRAKHEEVLTYTKEKS